MGSNTLALIRVSRMTPEQIKRIKSRSGKGLLSASVNGMEKAADSVRAPRTPDNAVSTAERNWRFDAHTHTKRRTINTSVIRTI